MSKPLIQLKNNAQVDIEDHFLENEITSEHDFFAESNKTIIQNDATTKSKGSSTVQRRLTQ